jgi:hypothetical protein
MEAGSHSGIARLVQQSLAIGTSALFPSYVFVTIIYNNNINKYKYVPISLKAG